MGWDSGADLTSLTTIDSVAAVAAAALIAVALSTRVQWK